MKKTSEAQLKAVQKYDASNPEQVYYRKQKSAARAFTRMTTAKAVEAVAAVGVDRYREDLQALRDAIDEKLKAL
ncbi:hypothetical protein PND19_00985 [Ligilactobacillus ruminis]|uniref:hypothetical protein n=1 Tax=Ligilactobacillus ruminis TaxID=1623 RepID=UPI00232E6170|nr:hypothetical protein [Ligilactobacillus ruminis]MDB7641211.1 hypothetical protein [Ligilactobacillus ruminis]MDB7646125.1 hypothetical protein [Ligilactobacillus ruminis]